MEIFEPRSIVNAIIIRDTGINFNPSGVKFYQTHSVGYINIAS